MDPKNRFYPSALLALLLLVGAASSANAQAPGTCAEGRAQGALNVNNVNASIFNTGSLFFGGTTVDGNGYYVPKFALKSPVFASGIWIGGTVNNQLRFAGARYGNWNFWPGPLGNDGRPVNPANCSSFDRIYSVYKNDIIDYEAGGAPATDLAEWPFLLGAPVIHADGDPSNYDLAAGDRPDIIGDQAVWFVMNDVGNVHAGSGAPPLGVEVRVLAWAFSRADALGQATFYEYAIINKGPLPIENTYVTVFSDPDLGYASDDYVGYDEELSMGYVYNADEIDETSAGYGIPPAAGYDFFQGPIVGGDTLAASGFSYFINGGPSTTTGDPSLAPIKYNWQQGFWGDGTPMRENGTGFNQPASFPITKYAFRGDPVTGTGWTEVTPGVGLTPNPAGDRRLLIHTGPFTLNPGDEQDIVFGLVFAQASDRFSSITALRAADRLAQRAYDIDFELAPPPSPPARCTEANSGTGTCFEASSGDGNATLVWGYPVSSQNYLGEFEVFDKLLAGQGVADSTYNMEGFNIYRYPTRDFQSDQRVRIATFDKANGVTRVVDNVFDAELGDFRAALVASGSDTELQYSLVLDGLTNHQDYFYGITAYAHNEASSPKINESSPTLITVRPGGLTSGIQTQAARGDSLSVAVVGTRNGEGVVAAVVVDPSRVTGASYQVRFFHPLRANGSPDLDVTTYSIVRSGATNVTVVDGQAYYARTQQAMPLGEDIAVVDGYSFSVKNPDLSFKAFVVTSNASGPLSPFVEAVYGTPPSNFPTGLLTGGANAPTPAQQVGPATWAIGQGSARTDASYSRWLSLVLRGANASQVGVHDYEWRFVSTPESAINFSTGVVHPVTFQLWDIGIATPNDASDDVRLVPEVLDDFSQGSAPTGGFNLGGQDHAVSPGADDPYTDRLYWYKPVDMTPGQAGYEAAMAGGSVGPEIFARVVLVNVDGGAVTTPANYNQQLPEAGTTFRIVTAKPHLAGDTFTISTVDRGLTEATQEGKVAALDNIQIVPNPYMGSSGYETGNASRVVRFTNLPVEVATVRIYSVAGTLLKTITKDGASRTVDWNLQTENNLPVASGMYLIHIDVAGVGERVLKFGVVQRRTEITVF